MTNIYIRRLGRHWMLSITCLLLAAGMFGSGFWFGQKPLPIKGIASVGISPLSPLQHPIIETKAEPLTLLRNNLANMTPEMKEFLANRATLNAKISELRGHGSSSAPSAQAFALFQKQNAELLNRQRELGKIIAQQNAKNPIPTPPPLQIPPEASPQMKTYLTTRDQLTRDQIAIVNQHRNDDPAARLAAIQQWRQQNDDRFEQLQQEAPGLAQTSAAKPIAQSSTISGK